jgi:hypothetical protein
VLTQTLMRATLSAVQLERGVVRARRARKLTQPLQALRRASIRRFVHAESRNQWLSWGDYLPEPLVRCRLEPVSRLRDYDRPPGAEGAHYMAGLCVACMPGVIPDSSRPSLAFHVP